MAHRKAGGTAKNLTDSQPKYLGVKLGDGSYANSGAVIVRQRGTRYLAGQNVRVGRDHTLYAASAGIVSFDKRRKTNFDGSSGIRSVVSVRSAQ
jgi:large subunit ribosomal protein L27